MLSKLRCHRGVAWSELLESGVLSIVSGLTKVDH